VAIIITPAGEDVNPRSAYLFLTRGTHSMESPAGDKLCPLFEGLPGKVITDSSVAAEEKGPFSAFPTFCLASFCFGFILYFTPLAPPHTF